MLGRKSLQPYEHFEEILLTEIQYIPYPEQMKGNDWKLPEELGYDREGQGKKRYGE